MNDNLIEQILISDFDTAKRLIIQLVKEMCDSQREVCADVLEDVPDHMYDTVINAPYPFLLQ